MSGQDEVTSLMGDIDPRLMEFLRTKVNTFLKWDLVRFFHENPHTSDTAENIARYTGRDAKAIGRELAELAESRVLVQSSTSGLSVYTLATDQELRSLIDRFILACEDRQFRVKAIYHVIRGMHQ